MSIYSCIDRIESILSGAQAKKLDSADLEFFRSLMQDLESLDGKRDEGIDTKFELILDKIELRSTSIPRLSKYLAKELKEINSDLYVVKYGIGISSHRWGGDDKRIYSCIGNLEELLSSDREKPALSSGDAVLLAHLKDELTEIGLKYAAGQFAHDQLRVFLTELRSRLTADPLPPKQMSFKLIAILEKLSFVTGRNVTLTAFEKKLEAQYDALLESPLLFKPIQQGEIKERGLSKGECYGFAKSMADSELSPYKGGKDIAFNKAIYEYQKNFGDRQKDNQYIQRTRLTRVHFCPFLREQATQLYEIATSRENMGKDLLVGLTARIGTHATYLSCQPDGQVWFTDSNHGAFKFKDKDQFIEAYCLIYMYQSQQRPTMANTFYQVALLQEQKGHKQEDSITWSGKWRSMLTGGKYDGRVGPYLSIF